MKYTFYPDAPPLQQGHANHSTAWGWSQAMKSAINLIITHRSHRSIDTELIRRTIGLPIIFYPDFSFLGLRRFSSLLRCFLDTVLLVVCLPWLAATIRKAHTDRIFCYPQGWWYCLLHAYLVGRAAGLPIDFYYGDDIEALAILNNSPLEARLTRLSERTLLGRFDRVYTVSKGHAELLREKYGVPVEWLPLVLRVNDIEYSSPPKADEIRYIGYCGSVNELYREALAELKQVVVHLNETTSYRYKIALCVLSADLPDIFRDSSVIDLFINLPNAQLIERLKLCYANFLPFSFDPALRVLVSTAFSVKSTEYFAAGRPIMVYGPAYSSISRHFLENDLPLVETNRGQLERLFTEVERLDNPGLIARYREVVQKYHSPEALRRKLVPSDG